MLAGALGGPICVFLLTPLRNALTLASQDAESSALSLYQSVFRGGFTNGWTGGLAPVIPSCPQFCVMGPLFHFLKEVLGSIVFAVVLAAMAETTFSYGSQTLNAQLVFNRAQSLTGGSEIPLSNPFMPLGPGVSIHVMRNVVALSGIRIFSGPCQALITRASQLAGVELGIGLSQFLGDFLASLGAAVCSAPLNQCYNFAVTSEAYKSGGLALRTQELLDFLSRSYLSHGPAGEVTGLSRTLARDLFMRCAYVATLYAAFGAIERVAIFFWRYKDKTPQPRMVRSATVGVRVTAP